MARTEKCQSVSVTIITKNEEQDLPRCLDALRPAGEVIVVDCGSSDRTVEIARSWGAKVVEHHWLGYGQQKNLAMSHAAGEWVLNVDADEVVTPELWDEIGAEISSATPAAGYAVARKAHYLGRWILHGGWYPNYVTRLGRKALCRWSEPNVHEELKISGELRRLKNPMLHYTFRDIDDQIHTNLRYARQGAEDLRQRGVNPSLLKLIFKPMGKFIETYLIKRGFADGLAGFIISVNAAHSMFLKYAYLMELSRENADHRQ